MLQSLGWWFVGLNFAICFSIGVLMLFRGNAADTVLIGKPFFGISKCSANLVTICAWASQWKF